MYKVFKGQFLNHKVMATAKSYSVERLFKEMELIKAEDAEAHDWLYDKGPQHWARSNFRTTPKCDILLNNLCVSFNGTRVVLLATQRSILSMLGRIRMYLLQRFSKQRLAVEKWKGDIGPYSTLSKKEKILSAENIPLWSEDLSFHIKNMYGGMYVVDLGKKTCLCKR